VGWRHPEAEHEADALRLWNGRGAVRLHAAHACGSTSALLIERCVPGTTLGGSVPEQEQHRVVADLLSTLWTTPPPGHPFRPLREMCDMWADGVEVALPGRGAHIDPGLARESITIFRTFPESCSVEVLLCTDLHAGNVLASRREPWLAVDPKPYVGDPAYDVTQHLLNCEKSLLADPLGLTRHMADLLGLDPARVRAWQFARCVMESVHDRARYETALRLAP
jgi:streptomycin 6-kinase